MGSPMRNCEAAVIGAGPAGLSAAIRLAELGVETMVLDEKPAAGGQLFKQIHKFFGSERHMAGVRGFEIGQILLGRCAELGVPILLNAPAWGIYPDKTVGAMRDHEAMLIKAGQIVLATGASENALSFPGWTLPGVMGAGAAQTLVNYYRVRPGDRALVVGAGNVGLIVSYQLLQAGIEVVGLAEVAENVGGYMVHAAKIRRMGVPLFTRHTIVSAEGTDKVERCTIARADDRFQPVVGTEKSLEVDMVCLAVGLSPAVELLAALGAKMEYVSVLGGWVPLHNEDMMTSVEGVYVAGDLSGVEEASSAMEEGKLAAVSAAAALGKIDDRQKEAQANEIDESLGLLRRGPFGALIAQRKCGLFGRYRESCLTTASST